MQVKYNPYIPSEDKDFFILLRIGLWQRVEEELSPNPDWEYIFRLSSEQTVQGIVCDGIGLYLKEHPDLAITQDQNDLFLAATAQIISQNYKVNRKQAEICKILDSNNILYVILKGQGIAEYYHKPNLRVSGDIDFLFQPNDFEKAKQLLLPLESKEMKDNRPMGRYGFYYGDIPVEFHTNVFNDTNDLQKYLNQKQKEIFDTNCFVTSNIGGYPTKLPPKDFNLAFLFFHILKHLYNEGIGIRQLCDFAMCYNNYDLLKENPDTKMFLNDSLTISLWSQIYSFLVFFLGLDSNIDTNVINISENEGSKIWSACKRTGNFGNNIEFYHGNGFFGRNLALLRTMFMIYRNNHRLNAKKAWNILRDTIKHYIKIAYKKIK